MGFTLWSEIELLISINTDTSQMEYNLKQRL